MNKASALLTSIIVICLFGGCMEVKMRREIPSQEVIALDKGIAIINAQKWFMNNLKIRYSSEADHVREASYDSKGICLIQGLSNGREYTIEIRRTDIKGKLLYKTLTITVTPREEGTDYYVLVGASVGKAWELEKLPARLKLGQHIQFGNRTIYQFDKTQAIKDISEITIPVSGVIIKECAAYFPREIDSSRKMIKRWVNILRTNKKKAMLATVVPVTVEHDSKHPGRLNSILAFNDFIREYAEEEGIEVLDLEKALRISSSDRQLRHDYAKEDGLHLVKKAYEEALDSMSFFLDIQKK